MNKTVRLVVIIVAFFVAFFFLGLLSMAFGSDRGAIYGLLSVAIIGGIPYLVWWATGRMSPMKSPQAPVSSGPSGSSNDAQASSAWTSKQYLLLGVAVVIAAMLVFPPFRVLGPQGMVLRTGYAFIFDLPDRAFVDVGQLFIQWVGVLIVGAVAFFLISKRS